MTKSELWEIVKKSRGFRDFEEFGSCQDVFSECYDYMEKQIKIEQNKREIVWEYVSKNDVEEIGKRLEEL